MEKNEEKPMYFKKKMANDLGKKGKKKKIKQAKIF